LKTFADSHNNNNNNSHNNDNLHKTMICLQCLVAHHNNLNSNNLNNNKHNNRRLPFPISFNKQRSRALPLVNSRHSPAM